MSNRYSHVLCVNQIRVTKRINKKERIEIWDKRSVFGIKFEFRFCVARFASCFDNNVNKKRKEDRNDAVYMVSQRNTTYNIRIYSNGIVEPM